MDVVALANQVRAENKQAPVAQKNIRDWFGKLIVREWTSSKELEKMRHNPETAGWLVGVATIMQIVQQLVDEMPIPPYFSGEQELLDYFLAYSPHTEQGRLEDEELVREEDDIPRVKGLGVCPKCQSNDVSMSMRTTRAGDEGQTIFYRCFSCKQQWR
jgi:DNA-directed RNA polymerase subunit M/transcription elongation factor TFIIS